MPSRFYKTFVNRLSLVLNSNFMISQFIAGKMLPLR